VDYTQLLIREALKNTGLKLSTIWNPCHKSRLNVLLKKKVLSRMVSVNNHVGSNQVRSKFFKTKPQSQEFFLSDGIIQLDIIQIVTRIMDDLGLLEASYQHFDLKQS